MLLTECIKSIIDRYPSATKVYIAYSGGLDSHVLLHLCASIPELRAKLTAAYVHHGLQDVADYWETHCERVAAGLAIPYLVLRVDARAKSGESPEEAARIARYRAFAELMEAGELLLLAQHQDDQLETVLLQLFRGAGLQGLAGMPEAAGLGQGLALRPLLNISRQVLESYALQNCLTWVEDPTNQSDRFDRNYLRNAVLPLLKQRWPTLAGCVARSARHCGAAFEALQTETEVLFAELFDPAERTLDLIKLKHYSAYQQRLLVRFWFQKLGLRMPSESVIETLFEQLIAAQTSRDPQLCYQQAVIRRYRQRLYCLEPDSYADKADNRIEWSNGNASIRLGERQLLSFCITDSGIDYAYWQTARVTVGFRQGGEKMRLPGRQGRHALKKLFQEAAIPTWQRAGIPLIFMDGQLAAVADLWISSDVWVEGTAQAIRICRQHS